MKAIVYFGLACLVSQGALAAPSSHVAWTPETLRLVKSANAQHGQQLAATCAGCHNEASEFPNLEGQLATYLYKQLQDYKSGTRENAVMTPMTASLSDQDMADLSLWYSQQSPHAGKGGEEDLTRIVSKGDGQRMEPPCAVCHGGSGQGEKVDTPRLAGQKASYLAQTLMAYKAGSRANDLYARMRLIAGKLSDQEIEQLSDYYAKLR